MDYEAISEWDAHPSTEFSWDFMGVHRISWGLLWIKIMGTRWLAGRYSRFSSQPCSLPEGKTPRTIKGSRQVYMNICDIYIYEIQWGYDA